MRSTTGVSTWSPALCSLHEWYTVCSGAEGVPLFADDTALFLVDSDLHTLLSAIKENNWKYLQIVYLQQTDNR